MIHHIATPLAWVAEGALLRAKAMTLYPNAVRGCERRGWDVAGFGRDAEILLSEAMEQWLFETATCHVDLAIEGMDEEWLN